MTSHHILRPETPPPPYSTDGNTIQHRLQAIPPRIEDSDAVLTLSWTPPPPHITATVTQNPAPPYSTGISNVGNTPSQLRAQDLVHAAGYNFEITKNGRLSRDGVTRVFRGPTELIGEVKLHSWSQDDVTSIVGGIRRDVGWRGCVDNFWNHQKC